MQITILGTRGEIKRAASYHRYHSGVLIDKKLLLDCGEAFFLDHAPQALFISHLHPDHAFFVRLPPEEISVFSLPLYAPELYHTVPIMVPHKSFTIENYTITPIPVIHSIRVRSLAYLIEHQGKRILYTGDIISIEKKHREQFGHLDLVITDGSYMRNGGRIRRDPTTGGLFGHNGIPNLISLDLF